MVPDSRSEIKAEKNYLEEFEMNFLPDDSGNPFNWSRARRRRYIMLLAGPLGVNACVELPSSTENRPGSAARSQAPPLRASSPRLQRYFAFGHEVAALALSLFVGGHSIGPLVWGPVSENYGRKLPLLVSCSVYIGGALSKNTALVLVFRVLSGNVLSLGGRAPLNLLL